MNNETKNHKISKITLQYIRVSWAYLQRDWNKVFSCLFEFGECTRSSRILNFRPRLLLQIRCSWYCLQRLLIWLFKKGVQMLIWLWTSTVDQNKVFNTLFEFFCPYTWIYTLCYIHLCPYGAILSQDIIRILVLCGILCWCPTFGLYICPTMQMPYFWALSS